MLHLLALQIKEFETTPLKTTAAMNLSIKKKFQHVKTLESQNKNQKIEERSHQFRQDQAASW